MDHEPDSSFGSVSSALPPRPRRGGQRWSSVAVCPAGWGEARLEGGVRDVQRHLAQQAQLHDARAQYGLQHPGVGPHSVCHFVRAH